MEEASNYIYCGLTRAQKIELAEMFFSDIEKVFLDLHRDYAQVVLLKLSPAFLGRKQDLE